MFLAKTVGVDDFDTVLKSLWTSSIRQPEAKLLKQVYKRGVNGVAIIVGYQPEVTSVTRL